MAHEAYFKPTDFMSTRPRIYYRIMSWQSFIDPENGYVADNKASLEIKITATKPQTEVEMEKWLSVHNCSTRSTTKHQFTIANLYGLNAICLPPIQMNGNHFRIMLTKDKLGMQKCHT